MTEVIFRDVVKRYGHSVAVERFNLHLPQGELLALLGPSGCGKTTTLRMVAGFIEASEGSISIGGRDVTHLPPHQRNTGLVFQNYALFPHRSVAQNVAFGLQMRKMPKPEIARRVTEALSRVRLQDYAERLPKQLSGGQQQRVALARALVIEPDVLLLDEPLSNLDALLRLEMRNEIRALQKQLNLTAIFVTHDQEEALAIADRIVVMSKGRMEQVGTPREIYETPATQFVAGFTGMTNFLAGRVEGSQFLLADGTALGFGMAPPAGAGLLGVRPELVGLLPPGAAGPEESGAKDSGAENSGPHNRLPATIRLATYLGSVLEYELALADGVPLVARIPRAQSGGLPAEPGQAVDVIWPHTASRLFTRSQETA